MVYFIPVLLSLKRDRRAALSAKPHVCIIWETNKFPLFRNSSR